MLCFTRRVRRDCTPQKRQQDCRTPHAPPSPLFSQVFILKGVKVLCFDTLLQVLILKGLTPAPKPCNPGLLSHRSPRHSRLVAETKTRQAPQGVGRRFQDAVLNKGSIDDSSEYCKLKIADMSTY